MKIKAVIAAITPFLASDKKPDEVLAAVLAADKAAKDAAGSGLGARELEEKDQAAKDKAAKDKAAKDRDDDPESTNDEFPDDKAAKDKAAKDKAAKDKADMEEAEDEDVNVGDPSTPGGSRAGGKTAVDSAEVDRRIKRAVQARDELHTALREVEPIVGRIAADSAGEAYRAALTKLSVDTKGIPDSALPAMLKLAKDRATASTSAPAMDSAGVAALDKLIPGYGRLR